VFFFAEWCTGPTTADQQEQNTTNVAEQAKPMSSQLLYMVSGFWLSIRQSKQLNEFALQNSSAKQKVLTTFS
jgi:hypothetical protein